MVPALQLSRTNPNRVLKDRSASDASLRGRFKVLDLLVVVQVGSAALLLITAGLILRSLWSLSSRPLGYEPENLLSLRLASPGARMGGSLLRVGAFYQDAADRLAQLPGVESAAVTSNLAFGFNDSHNQFRPLDRPAPSPNDYPSSRSALCRQAISAPWAFRFCRAACSTARSRGRCLLQPRRVWTRPSRRCASFQWTSW